jgi:hypothetical protein
MAQEEEQEERELYDRLLLSFHARPPVEKVKPVRKDKKVRVHVAAQALV